MISFRFSAVEWYGYGMRNNAKENSSPGPVYFNKSVILSLDFAMVLFSSDCTI